MVFARRVFFAAALYGFVVLVPQYFGEVKNGQDYPPAITHPEYYYGFLGVALAWQFAIGLIAWDPIRFRPMMLCAVLEKLGFGLATLLLFALGRLHGTMLAAGSIDLVCAALFLWAYQRTPQPVPR